MATTGASGAWPLVGRDEELAFLRQLRSAAKPVSSVISGAAGVGKSRLAGEAMAEAAAEGWATLAIYGNTSVRAVPLGPHRTALGIEGSPELSELAAAVASGLRALTAGKGLLILADDCHELDEPSAALLCQLVAAGSMLCLFTARSGGGMPVPVTALWKDGLAERIELQSLSRRETSDLLAAGLGGSIEDATANRMWTLTEGNPLYLHEVVLSGVESGSLRPAGDEWQWRGEWAGGARLQEIVAARLSRLDPDQSSAMEFLALAGSLPIDLLSRLASGDAVERLEGHGLVKVGLTANFEVEIAHPVHAEVIRKNMLPLRRRAIWRNLVEELQALGVQDNADRVRLAWWSLEAGLAVDPLTLSVGTGASMWAIGHAISERLREVFHLDRGAPTSVHAPVVPPAFDLTIRMAQAAYEGAGGIAEGISLADTLAWSGEIERAESVLAEIESRGTDIDDRLRIALGLAWVRMWGRHDAEGAAVSLRSALTAAGDSGSTELRAEAYEQLAAIALHLGRPRDALALAERAAATQGVPLSESVAATPAVGALSFLGRFAEALELVDRAIPIAREHGQMRILATLMFTRAGALARSGQLEKGRELAEWLRDISYARDLVDAAASFGVLLGEILLREGRPASAARILRDSSGLLAERDLLGYRPWALYALARAKALTGDERAAQDALAEGRRVDFGGRHYEMSRFFAEVTLGGLAGRRSSALDAARAGAAWAREREQVCDEAMALDELLRLEADVGAAERIAQLAQLTDSALVGAMADHARAVLARNPEELLAIADRFADLGSWWRASEAAATASGMLKERGDKRAANAAAGAAEKWAQRCEGVWATPAGPLGSGPVRLTKREREIATQAAAGRSSKEIAERMVVSSRTVENHLYRIYVKLGVNDRAGLAAALAGAGNGTNPPGVNKPTGSE